MQVLTPYRLPPVSPVSEPTSLPAAVVAETIVRTVELGVTITDAAVDGDVTVVFCTLLDESRRHCPGCGTEAGLLRLPRLQRADRGRQRTLGGATPKGPRIQKSHPLPNPLTTVRGTQFLGHHRRHVFGFGGGMPYHSLGNGVHRAVAAAEISIAHVRLVVAKGPPECPSPE
jgi:hypothetical protein